MTTHDRQNETVPGGSPSGGLSGLGEAMAGWVLPAAMLLVLAAVLAYSNSLGGPFIFDDVAGIVENPSIRDLGNLRAVWNPPGGGETVTGRPILNLTFAINYALGGLDVRGYHLVNLAIHILAGLMLLGILRRTFLLPSMRDWLSPRDKGEQAAHAPAGQAAKGMALGLALLGALLWTLHPLQTESVTYVSQRAESLMGLFYLLTLYTVIRGSQSPGSAIAGAWYAGAALVCLLGMGTKEIMVSAPLCVLIYDRIFLTGSWRQTWRHRWPLYLGLACTWTWLGYLIQQAHGRGGTVGYALPITWWQYLFNQFAAICLYLKLTIWPHPLVLDYLGFRVHSYGEVVGYGLAVCALLAATAAALWRWAKAGFLGAWFWLILAPSSSVIPLVEQVEEHRMYLPLAALMVGLVAGVYEWWRRTGSRRERGWAALAGAAALTLVWGGLTYARNEVYQSNLAIWADTVRERPDNPRALGNLVFALDDVEQYALASAWGRKAVAAHPDDAGTHYCLARSLSGLAGQFEAANQAMQAHQAYEEAIKEYRAAIALYQVAMAGMVGMELSDYSRARLQLAAALAGADRRGEAEGEYRAMIAAGLDVPRACAGLGLVLADTGRYGQARQQLEKAVQLSPNDAGARYDLGRLLWRLRQYPAAMVQFEAALALHPDDARLAYEVAWLLATSEGAPRQAGPVALAAAQRACALTGRQNVMCLEALGAGYACTGRFRDAIDAAGTALQLAEQQGQTTLAEKARGQIDRYRSGKAYWQEHFVEPQTQPATKPATQPAGQTQPATGGAPAPRR